MKSEERHQLLTNDLEVVTTRTVGFFERHLPTTIAAGCAIIALIAVVFWWNQTTEADNSAGWTMLDTAKTIQDFGHVADKFKGTAPGQWAQLKISEKTAYDALPLMFTNRESAKYELKSAREGFDSLVQDRTAPSLIRERALRGLAVCLESTCDGDTSKAIDVLEQLIKEFPDTAFKFVATERIAALKKDEAKEFYTWFSKENPKPVEARPDTFKPGGIDLPAPGFDSKDFDDNAAPDPNRVKLPLLEKSETPAPPGDKPEGDAKSEVPPESAKTVEPSKPEDGPKPAATETPKEGDKPPENK